MTTTKPSKQPPAGLGRFPRDGDLANRKDNIELFRFICSKVSGEPFGQF